MVNEETRRRILAIAGELNYKVDKNASNLRRQHSGTIALLLFEDPTSDDSQINPFFVSMLGSITRACGQRGHDLLISFQQFSQDWHAEYEDCHKADGLILLGYGDYLQAAVAGCAGWRSRARIFVRWGAVLPDQPGRLDRLRQLQRRPSAARSTCSDTGRRRIAFLGDASEPLSRNSSSVTAATTTALREAGLPIETGAAGRRRSATEQSGYEAAADAARARRRPFDAVFAASDLIAIGAMRALNEHGLRVPEDVAVAGFDDIPDGTLRHARR